MSDNHIPSTTPRMNLSDYISDRSHGSLVRIAHEFGIQFDDISDVRYLCWFIELLKQIKDSNHNFPLGKYATIKALETCAQDAAKTVVHIYYGNV